MKKVCIVVVPCALAGVAAQAAVFSNGSFEAPPRSPFAYPLADGDSLGPWTVALPGSAIAEHVSGTHVGLAPYDGLQYLTFNGFNRAPGGYVFQDFDTTPSTTYTVTFAVGRLGATNGMLGIDAEALAGVSVLSSLNALAPAASGTWTSYSFQFTSTGPTTRLRFADASTETVSMDVALDGVVVVPAPGTAGTLAGTALLLARRRRR